MVLQELKCRNCGEELKISEGIETVTCGACGSEFVLDKGVDESVISDSIQSVGENIQSGLDAIRAQIEEIRDPQQQAIDIQEVLRDERIKARGEQQSRDEEKKDGHLETAENFLKSRKWEDAKEFFKEALRIDSRCVEAYIGLFMAAVWITSFDNLDKTYADFLLYELEIKHQQARRDSQNNAPSRPYEYKEFDLDIESLLGVAGDTKANRNYLKSFANIHRDTGIINVCYLRSKMLGDIANNTVTPKNSPDYQLAKKYASGEVLSFLETQEISVEKTIENLHKQYIRYEDEQKADMIEAARNFVVSGSAAFEKKNKALLLRNLGISVGVGIAIFILFGSVAAFSAIPVTFAMLRGSLKPIQKELMRTPFIIVIAVSALLALISMVISFFAATVSGGSPDFFGLFLAVAFPFVPLIIKEIKKRMGK